jgi:predicted TIM-barrel fold metal-dependent hydrolase
MGLSYDTWHYHYQNRDFLDLARACPDTQMVLDHFGTPLGVGPYATKKKEIFEAWLKDIEAIAECPNVVAKLGGLAMPDNGFGWDSRATPPSSDEFCEAQRDYYLHTIECFGPDRCMMESNFPVDRWSLSYQVLFNGLKKIVAEFSDSEKTAMFHDTAARVYRL